MPSQQGEHVRVSVNEPKEELADKVRVANMQQDALDACVGLGFRFCRFVCGGGGGGVRVHGVTADPAFYALFSLKPQP